MHMQISNISLRPNIKPLFTMLIAVVNFLVIALSIPLPISSSYLMG